MEEIINGSADYVFVGNEVWRIALLAITIITAFLLGKILKFSLQRFSTKFRNRAENFLRLPPDYWQYMRFTEYINLEILKRFNEEGIDFAFPTQTIYLAGDEKRPLDAGLKNMTEFKSKDE